MFETAELGRHISKKAFNEAEPVLQTQLLEAQRAIRAANIPVIILVSGVEGAGKGEVVNLLNTWLDARGVHTQAFWDSSDEERERPRYWRFWRALPPRGAIGILFGSWYTEPIVEHAFKRSDDTQFEHALRRIAEFEQLLVDDGAILIKFWFHLSKELQQERLKLDVGERIASPQLAVYAKHYDAFREVSERAIRQTDCGHAPWHVIEASDHRYQHLAVGRILLETLQRHLAARASARPAAEPEPAALPEEAPSDAPRELLATLDPAAARTVLSTVDLTRTLDDKDYEKEFAALQLRLKQLTWQARARRINTVLVFEGWDAAGKGGAIRRLVSGIDARLCRVISIAAPTDEEKAHHYLWRFWRHVPRAGFVTVYDRSWYGRVLVERVEGFAPRPDWERAYQEINDFEEQLTEHGVVVHKFWLHISPEEQLRRFKEREETTWKQYKITDEDWRNRGRWQAYEEAVHDMVSRTSTRGAPWTLVPANDKKVSRVTVLRTVCERLEAALAAR